MTALKSLGNSTASGLDGQDAISLKLLAPIIMKPLTRIINMSINQKKFPNRWKMAKILPLFKGKQKTRENPDSYRPISLLSVQSKIAERIVQKQLSEFLIGSRQLNPNQHSYRQNHSTTTAWCQLTDALFSATDQNLISAILAVDQSSAFDCVSHEILLRKLESYNISRNSIPWFRSYLENRTNCVSIGTKLSIMKPVHSGVPQGSVLGPILYAVYTNEMPEMLKDAMNCENTSHNDARYLFGNNCPSCGQLICYADDATMVFASQTRQENLTKLTRGLDKIERYLTANRLKINRTKTTIQEIMIGQKRARQTGSPPTLSEINPDGTTKIITSKPQCRLLGGTLQENMSWAANLEWGEDALIPAARQKLGVLKHIGKSLPLKSKKLLTDGLVLSKIRYLMAIWGGAADKQLRMIQTLMNDAARFVLDKPTRRDSTMTLMTECGWMSAAEMIDFHSLLLFWRVIRKNSPQDISEKITLDDDSLVQMDNPRLQHTKTAFRWRTAALWNTLPPDLRHNDSLKSFKLNTKKWILGRRGLHLDPGE